MAARSASVTGFVLLLLLLPVPSSSSHVKLNLRGSVYPDGYIYATMKIGEPALEYNLDVDTGSTLTWVQCSVPKTLCNRQCHTWRQQHPLYHLVNLKKLVPSMDPLCVELVRHPGNPSDKRCGYNLDYVFESTEGYLIRDKFTFSSNEEIEFFYRRCGYNNYQPGLHGTSPVDGVLGLGRGSSVGLISQLMKENVITKDVISHCIRVGAGGFLSIGENMHSSVDTTWVDMGSDDGATYTYFDAESYKMTVNAVKASLHGSLVEFGDPAMHLCWKGPHIYRSVYEVKPLFKTLSLVFPQQATLEIPPENYLMISRLGNVCFAILPAAEYHSLGDNNLIGAVTMQDRIVIYDTEARKIGWAHDLCRTSEPESVIGSRL
ncbi:hypothetical protein EJB05_24435 [Eragrostis curvula]|uniref:Peptidase A1 domain-containing protein n=1 Tax=Eragrostis curvula TaxID=38414 RepID=A0A5J9VB32_9POAL|nr:hypothetical protein EJB05_24435 [Eragrostis curvula]